ncbi:peptide-methionine (R)-S-oxide reductase MsrB [Beggiatoa leptomitoformis]|uniref:Peptide methionine sulfoxide reductase MsrB n=1 Tax=Beggiatoa leptomitoformis TaxID=288004 RepID=A0A2N9YIM5_9GAMM|nr:peptide-methionine (R)-S-oxide reductase MsrB [Beggiatoa leptomitoformis]ALG67409.1 peptide-methionine (R)-S-oxide reductase MsrB [Beggiatoa leptomitoformis]AUI70378.1 peptide-methionine (R)-S-oxide reductase MsrB [Beggiatoa leptomitoformis]
MTNSKSPSNWKDKTDAEWQSQLTPTQFAVCRQKGTEHAFTGEYYTTKDEGIYHCVCCGTPLFTSDTKYDSGSGWPSFWQPMTTDAVTEKQDHSLFMHRTEVLCATCNAHLGHVFDDGPKPTGLRYCMNSVALKLEKTQK